MNISQSIYETYFFIRCLQVKAKWVKFVRLNKKNVGNRSFNNSMWLIIKPRGSRSAAVHPYSRSPSGSAAPSLCPLSPSAGRPALPSGTHSPLQPAASGGSALQAPPPAHWHAPSAPDTNDRSDERRRDEAEKEGQIQSWWTAISRCSLDSL